MATLQQLRDTFYDILRETESDTSAYPLSLTDLLLNTAQQKICHGRVNNPLSKEEARKGQLPFLFVDKYYNSANTTSLSADITTTDTTITVASTNTFPSAGFLYIGGNIIEYTGTTATEFTGCTGILYDFTTGMEVSIAYELPSDYVSPINVIYNNKFQLEYKLYDDIWEDLNRLKGSNYQRNSSISIYDSPYRINPFCTIKDAKYLLVFQLNDSDTPIRLRYEKQPTLMEDATDTATISNDLYAKTTIPYLAVGEMLFNRGEEGRGGELINFALGQVKEMYDHYNDSTYQKISGVQYKTSKGGRLNI